MSQLLASDVDYLQYGLRIAILLLLILSGSIFYWLRRGRTKAWGEQFGLHRTGNSYSGKFNGHAVLVELEERKGEKKTGFSLAREHQHSMFVRARAAVEAALPEGLELRGARFKGNMAGAPVTTGDALFDVAFRVAAMDPEQARQFLDAPHVRERLVYLVTECRDFSFHGGAAHVRLGLVQATSQNPAEALDRAFAYVVHVADILAAAAGGQTGYPFPLPASVRRA